MTMIWWPAEQATKVLEESVRMTALAAPGQPAKTARCLPVAGSLRLTELPRRLATTATTYAVMLAWNAWNRGRTILVVFLNRMALAIICLYHCTSGSGMLSWTSSAINRSKFFCDPKLTAPGFCAQALRNLARSVLVIFRLVGIASRRCRSRAGVVPSRASIVL